MAKVLFADDSLSVRLVALRFLTAAGYQVTLAADGNEAIARFTVDRPDVVIADIIMPEKGGFAVCAYVRGQQGITDMPIVLTSPLVDEDTNRQAQMCGATAVIKKPFSWERLVTQIGTLLPPKQSPESAPETAQVPLHMNGPAEIKARLEVEQEHRRFEDQATELRNSLIKATETISMLEARLAQSQEHCSQLTQKIKEIEYAAAWAERLTKFLADLSESKLRETEPGVTSRTEGS